MSIFGIPTTRISDMFFRDRLLHQVQADQRDLFRLQTQLSTGYRFQLPSEDPVAAGRVIRLQSLLERKTQIQANITTGKSYMTATDSALNEISNLVAEARAAALGVIDTVSTDEQRAAASQQIQQVIQRLFDAGNTLFRGRYLFAGSTAQVQPFRTLGANGIEYLGNENPLVSYADLGLLFETNMPGAAVFGAISEAVRGSVDFNPVLTFETRLADLNRGEGINPGSVAVSDGEYTSVVDLSGAETIGDVAALLREHPPPGRTVDVEITSQGLVIRLDEAAANLTITEVAEGTTARELGIFTPVGVGNAPVVGADLDPILRGTTRLADVFGSRAQAVLRSSGADNDIILEANLRGEQSNGVTVRFQDDPTLTAGGEQVDYDPLAGTITVRIDEGRTQAWHVVAALNDPLCAPGLPFSARLDPLDERAGGKGLIYATPPGELAGVTAGGDGEEFDQQSGLQIVNAGSTFTISLAGAETVEDVLNILNSSGAGVLAEINAGRSGIDVRSCVSGCDFAIGENGGATASQLGLRSFVAATRLDSLNHASGVTDSPGTDFVITRADGVQLEVDVAGMQTVADVLEAINANPANTPREPGGGPALVARLAAYGNGIELVDDSVGPAELSVRRAFPSRAASELGLLADGQETSGPTQPGAVAATAVASSAPDSGLIFQAIHPGNYANGIQIVFQDTGGESFTYDDVAGVMTFTIDAGVTDANRIIELFEADPVAPGLFSVQLDPAGSTGLGAVDDNTATPAVMAGGAPQVLTGSDAGTLETEGIFTALLRLRTALDANDLPEIQRAVEMLDRTVLDVNFARAELGAKQQALEGTEIRLEDEQVQLREILSLEYDADLVEVISNLTARQMSFEASLQSTSQILRLTLLDYL